MGSLWSGMKRGDQTIPMQSISIAGFEHTSFVNALQGIDNISKLFTLKYPSVKPLWRQQVFGQTVLTFDNCYVTPHNAVSKDCKEISFGRSIDPNGILRKELQGRGVHLEDNIVEYYHADELEPFDSSIFVIYT